MDMAIKTVMNLHDFAPSPDVNAAFSGLVAAAVQATALPNWCNDEVCREVQRRCSLSESEMEMYWSRRIASSTCPQQELEKFWYIDNYCELVRREVGLLGGSGLSLTDSSRAAMIGSGPLPLTAWCLWYQTGTAVGGRGAGCFDTVARASAGDCLAGWQVFVGERSGGSFAG